MSFRTTGALLGLFGFGILWAAGGGWIATGVLICIWGNNVHRNL